MQPSYDLISRDEKRSKKNQTNTDQPHRAQRFTQQEGRTDRREHQCQPDRRRIGRGQFVPSQNNQPNRETRNVKTGAQNQQAYGQSDGIPGLPVYSCERQRMLQQQQSDHAGRRIGEKKYDISQDIDLSNAG